MVKTCPYCSEELHNAASACRFCGLTLAVALTPASTLVPGSSPPAPLPKDGMGFLLTLLGLALVVLFSLNGYRTESSTAPSANIQRRAKAVVERDKKSGLIRRYTCVDQDALVDPGLWSLLHQEGKRGLAMSLAALCHGRVTGYRMTIKDADGGGTLASFVDGQFELP